jgi:hypothetical protein
MALGSLVLIAACFAGSYAAGRTARTSAVPATLVQAGARSIAYTRSRASAATEAEKIGRSQGELKGRNAGALRGAADGRSAGRRYLAKLQAAQARAAAARAAQARAATATAPSTGGSGCPAGEVRSQAFNNPGQCVATGYSPGAGQNISGAPIPPQFVDPNGVECTASLVVNGYCEAP